MKLLFSNILPAIFACTFSFCNSSGSKPLNETTATPTQPSAKVYSDSIITETIIEAYQSQSGLSYAYYLPKAFSASTTFPVIIFFDPHGDGSLPVKKYAGLAKKNNFILVGCNDSKNGMQFEQSIQIANKLVEEVKVRFHTDENNISLCGFSGGAKVAMLAAAQNTSVSKVIYCGAVQPWQNATHLFSLLGFVGVKDMNYADLVQFNFSKELETTMHYLIEWNGKHEWADSSVFQYAFIQSLSEIPSYVLIKMTHEKNEELQTEQRIKQDYIAAFSSKDLSWWKHEINALNKNKSGNVMNERLLGYISLACYSYSKQLLAANNLPALEKTLTIYRLADPDNKDMEMFWAEYRKRTGN